MVFPGRLSTGCFVCRKRKVKCDGEKPACRRCVAHNRYCTGYPAAFAFRAYKPKSTQTTSGNKTHSSANSSREHRSEAPTDAVGSKGSKLSLCSTALTPAAPGPLLPTLAPCWESQSLGYFYDQHVLHAQRSPCEGHLAFLPDLLREKGNDPCLKHAVLSVSYLSLHNASRRGELHANARRHYGMALTSLITALSIEGAYMKDEVFAAALFLSMFLDMSGDRNDAINPHIPGIYSLMQLRGRPPQTSKYGRDLFGWAFTQTQIQAVANNQYQYASLPSSINMIYEPDFVYRSGIITGKISEFCQSAQRTRASLRHDAKLIKSLHSILWRAHCILDEIDTWNERIPSHWRRQYLDSSPQDSPFRAQQNPCDRWSTCFLAVVQATQIVFYVQVIACCDKLDDLKEMLIDVPPCRFKRDPDSEDESSDEGPHGHAPFYDIDFEGRIEDLTDLICSTINSNLGQINPVTGAFQLHSHSKLANSSTLLWPMWLVSTSPYSTDEQVSLCQKGLQCIGTTMGYRLASVLSGNASPLSPFGAAKSVNMSASANK
ncbi:Zn(II)2Cys6 transcription factor [Aspergillus saccharolyticus JOP 1030-1]|uniref:Zn(2)-C6 fungal-type domain-containing protein n=1 Tax=Aspergillus saccharolyticus JOP 1030-1 TaxID=1450539 RepID=A0A318ZVZ4_9EURO|nr:hypothetical protein BP01DRAFT_371492 [Aspergillus saccharolyticus JOP 1030-1]PYH48533.1 hypothetical protein BP01DRAFT_371492 [Aspergillus saccharolyticus JOP 1030-1]